MGLNKLRNTTLDLPTVFEALKPTGVVIYCMLTNKELLFSQVQEIIASALKCLKSPNTEPFYRRQSFEVIKCFLVNLTLKQCYKILKDFENTFHIIA